MSATIVLWMTLYLLMVVAEVGTYQPTQVAALLTSSMVLLLLVSAVPRSTRSLLATVAVVWMLLAAVTHVGCVSASSST